MNPFVLTIHCKLPVMNTRIHVRAFLVFACWISCLFTLIHAQPSTMKDPDYPQEWAKIDSLERDGLFRSAQEMVDGLYTRAKADGKEAQLIKCMLFKAKYLRVLEEEGMEKAIAYLNREVEIAQFPRKQILQSVLASLYADYLDSNSWEIRERTALSGDAGEDITTWPAATFERRIADLFLMSVQNTALKSIPLTTLGAILEPGKNVEGLWTSLYDLLAFRAISHFANTRSFANRPAYRFYLNQPEAFADAAVFNAFTFTAQETDAPEYRALLLFQEVLRNINADTAPAAWVDADLKRLQFVHDKSVLEQKDSLFVAAVERLERRFPSQKGIAEAMYARASIYVKWGNLYDPKQGDMHRLDKVRAKSILEEAIKRFPGSYGAQECTRLLVELTAKSIAINLEEVLLPEKPALLSIRFRNTPEAFIRVVKLSKAVYTQIVESSYDERWSLLRSLEATKSWSTALPDDGDLQEHRTEIALAPLPLGRYAILVSEDGFRTSNGSYEFFYVSNLSYFHRSEQGASDFLVTHRESGKPLEGVEVTISGVDFDNRRDRNDKVLGSSLTDKQGIARFSVQGKSFSAQFVNGKDTLDFNDRYYEYGDYRRDRGHVTEETQLFLDRAIYRPGQLIYFKGICLSRQQGREQGLEILSNRSVTVTLRNANYEEVSVQSFTTNVYGSFSGSFTAPEGGLLGEMRLEASIGPSSQRFRVEEYKRPRFEVSLLPLAGEAKLGGAVTVSGEAKNYAGNGVDGAKVTYRVIRSARFPWWGYWWRGGMPSSPSMEIAHGETVTDASGAFQIPFVAAPDPKVPADQLPTFQFEVHVDVVDITGETHSGTRTVQLGYVSMRASIDIPETLDKSVPPTVTILTENLDGQSITAEGTIQVFSLERPNQWFIRRYWDKPDRPTMTQDVFKKAFPWYAYADEDDAANWKTRKMEWESAFNTAQTDTLVLPVAGWPAGSYLLVLQTKDAAGKSLELRKQFEVYDSGNQVGPAPSPIWASWNTPRAEPGETPVFQIFNGQTKTPVYMELKRGQETLQVKWLSADGWNATPWTLVEADRGDIAWYMTYVRNNRAFTEVFPLEVPWTNKQLQIEFQTFRDKLLPGQQEEWRLRITGPASDKVAAELLAGMYDASLDQFVRHEWDFNLFSSRYISGNLWNIQHFNSVSAAFENRGNWSDTLEKVYPSLNTFGLFEPQFFGAVLAYQRSGTERVMELRSQKMAPPPAAAMAMEMDAIVMKQNALPVTAKKDQADSMVEPAPEPAPLARTNLNETVFFFPQLKTDSEGSVILSFKMNEALTRWKLMLLAHTKDLKHAYTTRTIVTQKDLMVFPNVPRFVRENDAVEFTAKVSNLSTNALQGYAKLEFFDAVTMQPIDADFGNTVPTIPFSVGAGLSAPVSWKLKVPYGKASALTYRISAVAANFSDAEENTLPVLSNRMLVTETLPLYVRGNKDKTFTLESMKKAGESTTLSPFRLTLEFTSNPAWLAVKALPYLMEYPYECSEQVFSRYYANTLANSVVESTPKIKAIFEQWKHTDALESQLSKNQELKAVLLEETPWVFESQSEEQQRKNIAVLFDLNRMRYERSKALEKLRENQYESGGFPWFANGPESWYITQHIIAGLAKLQFLGIPQEGVAADILGAGLNYLDAQVVNTYKELLKQVEAGKADLKADNLSAILVHYLYTRSYLKDREASEEALPALKYYLSQAATYWNTRSMMEQGMVALALQRFDEPQTAARILASLRERALHSEELGMYWKMDRGYYWHQRPIENQALMIEVFDEIGKNKEEVDELKLWLLNNKRTNDWETTKATAEAVYALFRAGAGASWLSSSKPVSIKFSEARHKKQLDEQIAAAQKNAEPGTGNFKVHWQGADIQTSMHTVQLKNPNAYVAWGGLFWQYFEDLDKIKTFEETPLVLKKVLFKEEITDRGPVLIEVDTGVTLKPGDKIVVRLILRVDREMEFVHLKDMRASGLEPINALSGYRWQGGLGYYESPGDVATNFFIDFLPKGMFVFEYPLRVNHRGEFSNGITSIQCMYAPEFSSHSQGIRIQAH